MIYRSEFNSFSLRLAGYLMYKGFVLKLMRDDQKSRRKIFIFNDSPELQSAIQDYLIMKQN